MRVRVLALPWAWMAVFFAAPFAIVLTIALGDSAEGLPPYAAWPAVPLNSGNFRILAEDPFYRDALGRSLWVAAVTALLCLLLGYPMALAIARARGCKSLLLMLVVLPFWTSFLLRVTAWIGILQDGGWLNAALLGLGLVQEPLRLLFTDAAMYCGLVYCYLPFLVLPLYATLSKLDPALLDAAADLGAPPWRAFLAVTLPLSMPGVVAGMLLVFIPVAGEFVIPELLGSADAPLIGRVLWTEFFQNRDWPLASALAILLLVVLVVPIGLFQARA